LLGINHFDPEQPEMVAKTLRLLHSKYNEMPVFAAVEADKQLHQTVSSQRVMFRQLLLEEWPELTELELAKLDASFLFEPEAHRHVYDNVQIVWLDAGRTLEMREEDHHAKFRVRLYKSWLNGNSLHNSLKRVGDKAWEVADPERVDLNRSRVFYERTVDAMRNCNGKWSFAVVGAGHTDDGREGTMANLLANSEKFSVHRHVLR
jgi:hypothetical protein